MAKKILVATNNKGKVAELLRLLDIEGLELITPEVAGLADFDVEETGVTFEENAILKARAFAEVSGLAALADDSGLEVEALNGEPGVYSKRYAGENMDDAGRIDFLLNKLKAVPAEQRAARFVAVIVLAAPDGTIIETQPGYCPGAIGFTPQGTNGFGYDPIFIVEGTNGQTMAELSNAEKDAVSHRGNAVRAIRPTVLSFEF